jgi:hypothetical protein
MGLFTFSPLHLETMVLAHAAVPPIPLACFVILVQRFVAVTEAPMTSKTLLVICCGREVWDHTHLSQDRSGCIVCICLLPGCCEHGVFDMQ